MSELPEGIPPAREPQPRDSASGIVLRSARGAGWEVLLGLRSAKARFMPGHLSFPGGGLDPADRPAEAGSWERCATREVVEETGVSVEPSAWLAAGERVTPPIFPLRFRTRFFVARAPAGLRLAERPPSPGEIEEIRFSRPGEVLGEWRRGACRLPPPVLPILRALAADDGTPEEAARRVARANAGEEVAPRIEFAPSVWMLPVRTATLPPATHTNVWLPGAGRFVVVDPGSADEAELSRLLAVVQRRCGEGAEPDSIVLTHHHRDHVDGCARLAARLGLPVRAHPATLRRIAGRLPGGVAEPTWLPLNDGEQIDLDGLALRALLTPGHAPGHLALELVGRAQLVAGDLLSGLSTIMIDPHDGDMELYLASLERAAGLGCRMLFPGHGPPLPGKALPRLVAHRRQREARILGAVAATGGDLARIAAAAYAEVPRMPAALTERQTLSHLIALERRGRARRVDADGRQWEPA